MIDDALLDAARSSVRERLSAERYAHTLRVADTIEHLAGLHDLAQEKARLAALLHDSVREADEEELLRIAGESGIAMTEFEREQPILLHGPVAAELAKREFGVEDEEVLEAIRSHTLGEPGMGQISLALYVADKIEPDRDQPGVEDLRELVLKDLQRAAATALEYSISYNEQQGRPIHPKSQKALEWLEGSAREHSGERGV